MLRPICRMLIKRGFNFWNARDVLARAFTSACADYLKEEKMPLTAKRIAVFTGLPFADVARIFPSDSKPAVDLSGARFTQITSLFTAWHVDPRFGEPFGGSAQPLFVKESDGSPSFEALAREFAPDFDPEQLRAELEQMNAVSLLETGLIRLNVRAYIPTPFSTDDSERFGRMMAAYANTMEANSRKAGPGKGMFDRHATADFCLSEEDEAEFHRRVRDEGQSFLVRMDEWLSSRERDDRPGRRRPGVAVFFFHQNEAGPRSDGAAVGSAERNNDINLISLVDTETRNVADTTPKVDDRKVIDTLNYSQTD